MSRGYTNQNPGNIRHSRVMYQGEVCPSKDASFKQFQSMAYGFRAMFVLLHTYSTKYHLNTLRAMIERYAPPEENETTEYVNFVSTHAKIADIQSVDTLNQRQMVSIVTAMARMENGSAPDIADVLEGWEMFIRDYNK